MPLESFAPEQWAQELTAPHYQIMLDEGWPEEIVQQAANTIFQFSLLSGQLLMQETQLVGNPPDANTPPPAVEMSEPLAIQVMDYFAETIRHAIEYALALGLPGELRGKIVEMLAEDVYSYCKQMTLSVAFADPAPARGDLSAWLIQTAQEAVSHYKNEYENEFGPVALEPVEKKPMPPAQPQTADESPHPAAHRPEQTEASAPPPPDEAVQPSASASSSINLKLAAVAMLLKAMPKAAHNRILNLFPSQSRQQIHTYAQQDDWLDSVDHQALNDQLQSLKAVFNQPVNHPSIQLLQLVQNHPWQTLQQCLATERPIWLRFLTSLKQGDPPEQPMPLMLQHELLAHLNRQLGTPLEGPHVQHSQQPQGVA